MQNFYTSKITELVVKKLNIVLYYNYIDFNRKIRTISSTFSCPAPACGYKMYLKSLNIWQFAKILVIMMNMRP